MIIEPLQPLSVKIDDLNVDPANVRLHDERNLDSIRASLEKFGQRQPIVVQKQGMIVRAGNGRVIAAKAMGWTEMAAVVVDESDVEATAYAIADNRTAELAEWDEAGLAQLLESLPDDLANVAGFTDEDMAELLESLQDGAEIVEDEPPEVSEGPSVARRGDVWTLNTHRVACGDARLAEDVEAAMDGQSVSLCFTSPPYANQRDYGEASELSDWDGLMQGVFDNLPMSDDGQVLVNLGLIHRDGEWVPYWDGWIEWMRGQGWRRFGWYVWDKLEGMPGDWSGRLAPSHEWIFHFNEASAKTIKSVRCKTAGRVTHKPGKRSGIRAADGEISMWTSEGEPTQDFKVGDSVIRCSSAKGGYGGHPAPFTTKFACELIKSWPGDVYDPFLGSGTTIIAAEQLNRTCYGLEIEPKYVDVIITRWQNFTGEQATLDGVPFEEVKAERIQLEEVS